MPAGKREQAKEYQFDKVAYFMRGIRAHIKMLSQHQTFPPVKQPTLIDSDLLARHSVEH